MSVEQRNKILLAVGLWAIFAALLTRRGQKIASETGGYIVEKISAVLDLIKKFEGFSPTPYRDAGGYSIGYGHFIQPGESFTSISEQEAAQILENDTASAQSTVEKYVRVPLNQQSNAALVSLVYNIGAGAFKNSTLLKKLNAGDYQGAADQFLVWNKSQGTVIPALVERRSIERDIFLS